MDIAIVRIDIIIVKNCENFFGKQKIDGKNWRIFQKKKIQIIREFITERMNEWWISSSFQKCWISLSKQQQKFSVLTNFGNTPVWCFVWLWWCISFIYDDYYHSYWWYWNWWQTDRQWKRQKGGRVGYWMNEWKRCWMIFNVEERIRHQQMMFSCGERRKHQLFSLFVNFSQSFRFWWCAEASDDALRMEEKTIIIIIVSNCHYHCHRNVHGQMSNEQQWSWTMKKNIQELSYDICSKYYKRPHRRYILELETLI